MTSAASWIDGAGEPPTGSTPRHGCQARASVNAAAPCWVSVMGVPESMIGNAVSLVRTALRGADMGHMA